MSLTISLGMETPLEAHHSARVPMRLGFAELASCAHTTEAWVSRTQYLHGEFNKFVRIQ